MTEMPPPVIPAAFEDQMVEIPFDRLIAIKQLPSSVRLSHKFDQIASTVASEGLVETPVVARCKDESGQFLLLDGYARIEVLRSLGKTSVTCLIATDDEAFSYNKRLCRLATIQEHKMILKLVEHGMPEKRIAEVLRVDISTALLHKSCDGRASPFPGQTYPATSVMGVPRAVKPLSTATRTWNSAT